ncbi:cupin domain-containing protein [Streptomyces sp. NPDC004539]|uniref:cupin domain-containing protein n=1 Tax=Streptomyces sp. NPDC004539 TaxID=3154280 RepID=UPI00339E52BE
MTINIVPNSDGELIDVRGGALRVLEDGSRTGHRLGIAEVTLNPGYPGPPQHFHREHDETFYILSGTVEFVSGHDTHRVGAGQLVTAPIGTPHTFNNPDRDEPATLLFTSTPDLYIQYFRDLQRLKPGPDGLDPADVAEVMKNYATETWCP